MFLLADFIQWLVHILLHRIPKLWEFHKVHHSVKEMGFAAHLRYHWMESIIYKTALYLPFTIAPAVSTLIELFKEVLIDKP